VCDCLPLSIKDNIIISETGDIVNRENACEKINNIVIFLTVGIACEKINNIVNYLTIGVAC
jgi:hypothetical protein